MSVIVSYLRRQMKWSEKTFGPGPRTIGITKHIEKECEEIRQNPTDLEEWIDILILGLDGYWRAGGKAEDLMLHLQMKQDKNFARQWPAPISQDLPVEHVR